MYKLLIITTTGSTGSRAISSIVTDFDNKESADDAFNIITQSSNGVHVDVIVKKLY